MGRMIGGACAVALAFVALTVGARADKLHTVYRFAGTGDGEQPHEVVQDALGNLYGTTARGGTGARDCGTIFKIAPDGTKPTLYAFNGRKDGGHPFAGVTVDGAGNLYGTTNGSSDN